MSEFNVINFDFNSKQFYSYNIIPYLVRCYEETNEKIAVSDNVTETLAEAEYNKEAIEINQEEETP